MIFYLLPAFAAMYNSELEKTTAINKLHDELKEANSRVTAIFQDMSCKVTQKNSLEHEIAEIKRNISKIEIKMDCLDVLKESNAYAEEKSEFDRLKSILDAKENIKKQVADRYEQLKSEHVTAVAKYRELQVRKDNAVNAKIK